MATGIRVTEPRAPRQRIQPSSTPPGVPGPVTVIRKVADSPGAQPGGQRRHPDLVPGEAEGLGGEVLRPGAEVGDPAGDGAGAADHHGRQVEVRPRARLEGLAVAGGADDQRQARARARRRRRARRPGAGPSRSPAGRAVVASTDRTTGAGQSWRERSSAAAPLTRAVAAEVPLKSAQPRSPGTAPRTPSPTATTSGLTRPARGSPGGRPGGGAAGGGGGRDARHPDGGAVVGADPAREPGRVGAR